MSPSLSHSPLPPPPPSLNLSSSSAVYLLSSDHLIFYITKSTHSTAITPLTPKGSLTARHAAMSLYFLMGPRMWSYTRGAHPECSLCLGRGGFEIHRIINNCTICRNFPALQVLSQLGSNMPLVWLAKFSFHKGLKD